MTTDEVTAAVRDDLYGRADPDPYRAGWVDARTDTYRPEAWTDDVKEQYRRGFRAFREGEPMEHGIGARVWVSSWSTDRAGRVAEVMTNVRTGATRYRLEDGGVFSADELKVIR